MPVRCCWLLARPSRDFVPAADSLSCARKKVSKESAPVPSPLRCAARSPAMLGARGPRRTPFATLRSDSRAESVVEACFARASGSCASRLLQRGTPKNQQPNSQQPNPKAGRHRLFIHSPFSAAEERKALRPCAQRTSRTDSARLFEQSVAARVPGGASRLEYRREPEAQRRAARSGATFCLLFGRSKRRSPAGATSRLGLATKPHSPKRSV
jgi:hypothetical protein